jgi:hypothetical protein
MTPFGRPRCRWENNLELRTETRFQAADWIQMCQKKSSSCAHYHGNKLSSLIKDSEFTGHLSVCHLVIKDFAPWSALVWRKNFKEETSLLCHTMKFSATRLFTQEIKWQHKSSEENNITSTINTKIKHVRNKKVHIKSNNCVIRK